MMSAQIHGKPTDDDRHGTICPRGDQEQGCILGIGVMMNHHQHGESGDGQADGPDGEEKAMVDVIRQYGHRHTEPKCCGPRWDRV